MASDKQARRFMLTLNNEEMTDDEFYDYCSNLEHMKYFIFQREEGAKKGTPHIQAFIVFTIGKRFSTIKGYFPTAHIEESKGSNIQCRDYCSKSETRISGPFEYGKFSEERERTDVKNLYDLIESDADDDTIRKLCPSLYLRYREKISSMREDLKFKVAKESGPREVEVTYLYGPPGSGKTSSIYAKHGYNNCFSVTDYSKGPFDRYSGESVLILDEFRCQIHVELLLKLLDVYPVELPCRFSNKVAMYNKVYIVSNFPFWTLFKDVNERQQSALYRRVHNIICFDKKVSVEKHVDYRFSDDKVKNLLTLPDLSSMSFDNFPILEATDENLDDVFPTKLEQGSLFN